MRRTSVILLLVGTVVPLACAREERAPSPACPDAGRPVDPALLAFLSRARAAHHTADAHEAQERLPQAIETLDKIVKGARPTGEPTPAEVREVIADTQARIADLKSRLSDFSAAIGELDAGLALVPEPGYFRGHLFEVRGVVEERRAKALRASGATEQAEKAEQRALDAFSKAMDIHEKVIKDVVPSREQR
jgi:tetratricopeptide (TPR) repeat protein